MELKNNGRPKTERHTAISVRVTPDAARMLSEMTRNKSEFIDGLIRDQYARWVISGRR